MASSIFSPEDLSAPAKSNGGRAYPIDATLDGADPTSEEQLVGRIRTLFSRARSHRQPTTRQWQANRRVFSNRTWASGVGNWPFQPEIPEIRPIIASCVAWVTDQRPALDLVPFALPFTPQAQAIGQLTQDMKVAVDAVWHTYHWESVIEQVVWDAYQFDVGFFKVCWDAAAAGGMGDVGLLHRDPWMLYLDPAATSWDTLNYLIDAQTISLQELDRRFPGSIEKFGLSSYTENLDEVQPTTGFLSNLPRTNTGAVSPATSAIWGLPGQAREHAAYDDKGVTLLECWLREHTTEKNKDGSVSIHEEWRCVCVAGGHVLLNKRATELYPFPDHPYHRYTPEDLGQMYDQSMVELLTPAQRAINRLLAALQQGTEITGNPIMTETARGGAQRTRIAPKPGQRVTLGQGGQMAWLPPPQMSQMMPDLIKFYIGEMEKISGLSAISRGLVPQGRLASDVLDSVQESGFVRIRLALRNLEFTLADVGQQVVSIISEFYTEPRLTSLIGPDGQKMTQIFKERHFYTPGPKGESPLRFQVRVNAGSSLPTSRNARIAEADTLFAINAIDRPALLEIHNFPNRQAVLSRMSEMDAKGISQAPTARGAAGRQT